MADIGRHKCVGVAPTAEFGDGIEVMLEEGAVQRVASAWLAGDIECVHDAGVENRFAERRSPMKFLRSFELRLEWRAGECRLGCVCREWLRDVAFSKEEPLRPDVSRKKREEEEHDQAAGGGSEADEHGP